MSICEDIVNEIENQENKITILNNLMITESQWGEHTLAIRKINDDIIHDRKHGLKENYWTFIIICAYLIDGNEGSYQLQHILSNKKIPKFCKEEKYLIYFQYSPYLKNKSKGRGGKPRSIPELAFGNISNINGKSELEYHPINDNGWVGFAEMKVLDDINTNSTGNPIYNQLVKYIRNALIMQTYGSENGKKYPKSVYLTLVTPKLFYENRNSRLYGYKFNEYTGNDKTNKILNDIPENIRHEYPDENWKLLTKYELEQRLPVLNLYWISFEDIFDKMPDSNIKKNIDKIRDMGENTIFENKVEKT